MHGVAAYISVYYYNDMHSTTGNLRIKLRSKQWKLGVMTKHEGPMLGATGIDVARLLPSKSMGSVEHWAGTGTERWRRDRSK